LQSILWTGYTKERKKSMMKGTGIVSDRRIR
jgi:hypothetical protein